MISILRQLYFVRSITKRSEKFPPRKLFVVLRIGNVANVSWRLEQDTMANYSPAFRSVNHCKIQIMINFSIWSSRQHFVQQLKADNVVVPTIVHSSVAVEAIQHAKSSKSRNVDADFPMDVAAMSYVTIVTELRIVTFVNKFLAGKTHF